MMSDSYVAGHFVWFMWWWSRGRSRRRHCLEFPLAYQRQQHNFSRFLYMILGYRGYGGGGKAVAMPWQEFI